MASSLQTTTNSIIVGSNQSVNGCIGAHIPDMKTNIANLSQEYVITFCILGALTFITIVLFIEEAIRLFLSSKYSLTRKHKAKWLLAVYPIVAVTSMIALLVPRTSSLNELVYSIYISVCVYVFVSMLIDLFGGPAQMLSALSTSGIHLSVPPLCCCFVCIPTLSFTRTRLQILRVVAMQFAILRPLVGYVQAIIWSNLLEAINAGQVRMIFLGGQPAKYWSPWSKHEAFPAYSILYVAYRTVNRYLIIIYMVSALLAVWSFAIIFRMARGPLSRYHVTPKFLCFQTILLINSVQPLTFGILVLTGVIKCEPDGLPAEAVGSRYNHMIMICEVFLLSIAARLIYFRIINCDEEEQTTSTSTTSSSEKTFTSKKSVTDPLSTSSCDSVVTLSYIHV